MSGECGSQPQAQELSSVRNLGVYFLESSRNLMGNKYALKKKVLKPECTIYTECWGQGKCLIDKHNI